MVRQGILSALILALTPISTGLWTQSTGEVIKAPCPVELRASEPARLPERCAAPRAGILYSVALYTQRAGDLAALKAERDQLKKQLTEERASRRRLETAVRGMISDHELALNVIRATCAPSCPTLKPAAIGAVITASVCASAWATYQFTR
jgi:hypothetical protein